MFVQRFHEPNGTRGEHPNNVSLSKQHGEDTTRTSLRDAETSDADTVGGSETAPRTMLNPLYSGNGELRRVGTGASPEGRSDDGPSHVVHGSEAMTKRNAAS